MIRDLIENGSVIQIVATVIAFGLILSSVLSLIYVIVGGITFILSAGNEEKIKQAVRTVRYAIIGLFISFLAFFLVSWITKLLDIPFDLTFGTILDLMNSLFTSLK
jgi:formate hydrogenlyase subunit 3/multisubunit Na+/H+ antiporter MnhD subunit